MPFKISSSLFACLINKKMSSSSKRNMKNQKMSYYLENGSKLFEELMASCDGKANPIRHYSAKELARATDNFHYDRIIGFIGSDYDFRMFKGSLNNRLMIIKIFDWRPSSEAIRDIIVSTQMSTQRNVLKLLGCCLEFETPALVYEYAGKGVLNHRGVFGENEPLTWKTRLCIAKQIANAITYLHTAFPTPIIHRDLMPTAIILDDDFVPKICDFSWSITIPPKQTHVEDLMVGTLGYLDPEYHKSSQFSEKSDVYSFGVILLVFLTGRNAVFRDQSRNESLDSFVNSRACDEIQTILDPNIIAELGGDDQRAEYQQLRDFLKLALLCIRKESEPRPEMIDVAKELVRIDKSVMP